MTAVQTTIILTVAKGKKKVHNT